MFRTIVILGILAVCAFMAGWFTIHRDDKETTIRFNRDEIRADTSKAIAKGRELLNKETGDQTFEGDFAAESQYQIPATDEVYAPQQATRTVPPWNQPQGGQQYGEQY